MNRLTKRIKEHVYYTLGKYPETIPARCESSDVRTILRALAAYEDTGLTPEEITALRAQLERESEPEPLTLERLREMDGQPVWVPDQTIKADAGKPQLSLVPPQIMHDIAVIREYGNRKYSDPDSWRRVDPQRYIDALLRHALTLGANPLGTDEESGLPHLWHLECNAAFLSEMYRDEFRRLLDSEWQKEN